MHSRALPYFKKRMAAAITSRGIILGALAIAAAAAMPVSAQTSPNADTADYIISDLETIDLSTPLWGYWYRYNDNAEKAFVDTTLKGNSVITSFDSLMNPFIDTLGAPDSRTFPVGHTGDTLTHGMRFAYILGDRKLAACNGTCSYDPHVGEALIFSTQVQSLDLSGSQGISFWAKADSAHILVNVSVMLLDTFNTADYSIALTVDSAWKKYTLDLKPSLTFKQPSYAKVKPFDPTVVKGVGFSIDRGGNALHPINGLTVDDVTINKWKYIEPTPEPEPEGIFHGAFVQGKNGFRAKRAGNELLVQLPSAYKNQSGSLQAIDVRGHVLASAAFGRNAGEVALRLGNGRSPQGKVLFRVITAKSAL